MKVVGDPVGVEVHVRKRPGADSIKLSASSSVFVPVFNLNRKL
jgi:hypothetical protein